MVLENYWVKVVRVVIIHCLAPA